MPRVRTTNQPDRVFEVDAAELADLRSMGLLLEVVPDGPAVTPPAVDAGLAFGAGTTPDVGGNLTPPPEPGPPAAA